MHRRIDGKRMLVIGGAGTIGSNYVKAVGAQSGLSWGSVGAQSGLSRKVFARSPREACIELLKVAEMGRKALAAELGLPSRSGYFGRILAELVADGLIELTIPDKPNSRLQKYRLKKAG